MYAEQKLTVITPDVAYSVNSRIEYLSRQGKIMRVIHAHLR